MTETVVRLLEWIAYKCESAAEALHREQCPHFMVFGGEKYVGQVMCQKHKGHWGKHRTYEGEKF